MLIPRSAYWNYDGVSNSMLREFDASPFHYFAKFIAKTTPPLDLPSLRRGRALHARVLEPNDFDERFPLFDGERRSNVDKARYAELEALAIGNDGCVIRDREEIDGMHAGVMRSPFALRLLDSLIHAEIPIAWDCAETGVHSKARLDAISKIGDLLIPWDLKTIDAVPTEDNIKKAIANYDLHRQAAHYSAAVEAHFGVKPADFYLVFIEKNPPHACAVHFLDGESLAIGERDRLASLTDLAMRRDSGNWKFQEKVTGIGLPEWKKRSAA